MQSYILYYVTLLSILVKSSQPACTTKPNSGIITALLPLHTGTDCTTVSLRGIQQAGALQATINSINPDLRKESNIIINLKIHDTCSNEDGAVKAALKAMVESDQTCLHPPLFMGFIGPEDKEILDAVQLVTRLFNGTHVIPYSHDLTESADESTFHVTTKQSQNQAQSIITILHQMKWTTFSLAVDSSVINQNLAKNILELVAEDPTLCIVDKIARFSDDASITNTLSGSSGHGVVFLADSTETAKSVLQANKISPKPMVLFINKVGLQSWQIPAVNSTLLILQETIPAEIEGISEALNASMYSTYLRQQDTDCKNVGDATACMQNKVQDVLQGSFDSSLLPLSYAARLMASSLLAAHKIKCRVAGSEGPTPGLCSRLSRIPSTEWRNFLQQSTATVKQNINTNLPSVIRFKTDIPSSVDVYIRNQFSLSLEKIGQISNENQLELLTDYSFPPTDDTNVKNKVCPVDKLQQMIPTLWTSAPKGTPAVLSEPVDKTPENEFYDMVMLLCGAGLGILVFFILMTYIVYSSFKVKTEKQSTGGSPTIQRRPSRIARWRRGSGQSSRASIRTID